MTITYNAQYTIHVSDDMSDDDIEKFVDKISNKHAVSWWTEEFDGGNTASVSEDSNGLVLTRELPF